jgi:ribose transport system substrate-binding protein
MLRRKSFWLAAAVCLALGGCSASKSAAKYRIAVIPKGLTHEHWQSVHRGALRAAADLQARYGFEVEVIWDGPLKENDAQEQINIVERNVARRVSGLALAPQHSETMVPAVEQAVRQGVPVVILDSDLARKDLYLKYIATDNYHGGQLAAQRLLDVLKQDGKEAPKLVLLRYQVGSESTEQREKGFEDVVAAAIRKQQEAGRPTITWLSKDVYAGSTVDSAEREAGPLLTRLKGQQIDGIFTPNESSTTGMLNALRGQGLLGQVRVVGFDQSEPILQALAEGTLSGSVVQDPYKMGYLGVWTLVQHLEGHDVNPDGRKELSTGEYLLTKENLNDQATRERFDPELQKQRTIQVPDYPKKK